MSTILINPLDETVREVREPATRLETLSGAVVGLLDISKWGGSYFLDRLEALLKDHYEVATVHRFKKPTFTKPAPAELIERVAISDCMAVIEALAD
jgi:hypothetical protein